jgi:hypothetical protein
MTLFGSLPVDSAARAFRSANTAGCLLQRYHDGAEMTRLTAHVDVELAGTTAAAEALNSFRELSG